MSVGQVQDRIRARARALLEEQWVRGHWIDYNGERWGPGAHPLSVWLERLSQLYNRPVEKIAKECTVCPEGAVYLACALDPKVNESEAEFIIEDMAVNLPLYRDKELNPKYWEPWESIPMFNDESGLSKEKIIKTLFG